MRAVHNCQNTINMSVRCISEHTTLPLPSVRMKVSSRHTIDIEWHRSAIAPELTTLPTLILVKDICNVEQRHRSVIQQRGSIPIRLQTTRSNVIFPAGTRHFWLLRYLQRSTQSTLECVACFSSTGVKRREFDADH